MKEYVLQFMCNYCTHYLVTWPFYTERDFMICSEECYDLAREQDFQNDFVLRSMEEEWN